MKHRYIINIAGNDTFSWNREITANDFTDTYEQALFWCKLLQQTKVEQLRITSITELPS